MYTVYKTINLINEKFYIGVHKTDIPNDNYLGSGRNIRLAIKKYGRHNFKKCILYVTDNKTEAYAYESQLVGKLQVNSQLCYNMMEGGFGGFDHINDNRKLYVNPMKNPEYVQRCVDSGKKTRSNNPERYANISRQNLKLAVQYNTGKKRPEHSKFMTYYAKSQWQDPIWKESWREKMNSNFKVVSPEGIEYVTNRLKDFCKERNYNYVSFWKSSKTKNPIKRGLCKGWTCINLENN